VVACQLQLAAKIHSSAALRDPCQHAMLNSIAVFGGVREQNVSAERTGG